MYFLTCFCQKSGCGATLLTSPFCSVLLLTQTHPRVGEVLPGFGPQSNAAQVIILIVSGPGGWLVSSWACYLALPKWTIGATPIWASSRNRQTL
jgi:hypothetical protein